jgi:ABC-2 type transport system permease protein
MRRILTPRYLVTTAATVAAFFVGALAAWYETVLLLGGLPIGRTVAGLAYAALYLAFAVALVAASAGLFRTGLGAALGALAVLLGLPIVGLFPIISDWVPSHLVGSTTGLLALGEPASEYLRASLTTVLATAGALWLAVVLAAHREV